MRRFCYFTMSWCGSKEAGLMVWHKLVGQGRCYCRRRIRCCRGENHRPWKGSDGRLDLWPCWQTAWRGLRSNSAITDMVQRWYTRQSVLICPVLSESHEKSLGLPMNDESSSTKYAQYDLVLFQYSPTRSTMSRYKWVLQGEKKRGNERQRLDDGTRV